MQIIPRPLCAVTSNGATKELTDDVREVYEAAYEHMGGLGERVLGFCLRYLPRDQYPQVRH